MNVVPVPVRRQLPALTQEEAARQSRLSQLRGPLLVVDGLVLRDAASPPVDDPDWHRIDVVLSGVSSGNLALFCPRGLLQAVLAGLSAGADAPDLPADLQALALELAFDPLLGRLEAALDAKVSVRDVSRSAILPATHWRPLTVDAFGQAWPIILGAEMAVLDQIMRPWPTLAQSVDAVQLPLTLRLGATGLSLGALRSLQPGDAVLMEHHRGRHRMGKLVVADSMLAPAAWNGQGWTLEGGLKPARTDREDWLSTSDMPEQGAGAPEAAQEDQIPVRLCFDLGRLDMPLGEIRQLAAGSVIELPGTLDTPVSLTVGGRAIGTGELVDIQGRLGVRIVRILGRG